MPIVDFASPDTSPTPNGGNSKGRNANGRFAVGNPGGPGNPHGKKQAQLRAALYGAVSLADVRAIAKVLVKQAREGDLDAVELLLDRLLGKPAVGDVEDQLARLEQTVSLLVQEVAS